MGEMADGSHHLVVFPVIQNKGNGSNGLCNRHNAFCIEAQSLRAGAVLSLGRRDDIVGVFQKMVCGILIAGLFRSGHGMAAHKAVFQALAPDFLMDAAFCAAHVCNQCSLFQVGPYGGKITCVVLHRCAEEYQVTFAQVLINSIQNHIHDSLFPGLLQTGAGTHIGHDTNIRPCFSDGAGNGAAYKPQSDECDGGIGHGRFFHNWYLLL